MRLRNWLILVALLYSASLLLPALPGGERSAVPARPSGPGEPPPVLKKLPREWGAPGWYCVIMIPWVCIMPAWWANPCLLVGCVCLANRNRIGARVFGWIALALAATFPIYVAWMSPHAPGAATIPVIAPDVFRFYCTFGPGFWVWLASIATLLVAAHRRDILAVNPGKIAAMDEV